MNPHLKKEVKFKGWSYQSYVMDKRNPQAQSILNRGHFGIAYQRGYVKIFDANGKLVDTALTVRAARKRIPMLQEYALDLRKKSKE